MLYIKSKQVVFSSVVSSRHLALRKQREGKQGNVALTHPLNISVFVCFLALGVRDDYFAN